MSQQEPQEPQEPSDAVLIEEHLQGSSTALIQLWMRYDGLVYGIAHSMVLRRDVAEDIRQIAEAKMPLLVKANLGAQVGEGQKVDRQLVHYLVEEYNRYLAIVSEATKDPVLARLFRSLESVKDIEASEADYQKKLSELGIAQSSLLSYMKKMYERSGIAD